MVDSCLSYREEDEVRAPLPATTERLMMSGRSAPATIRDPFRNFKQEHVHTPPNRSLAAIFRRPTDLMFEGDMQQVRGFSTVSSTHISSPLHVSLKCAHVD